MEPSSSMWILYFALNLALIIIAFVNTCIGY